MEELVVQAKSGDKNAFTELIILLKNDLYKIAKARLKNDDDVQDAIQDTMLEAFSKINQLKDISKFKFWIIKILINNCNKKYNKIKNDKVLYTDYDDTSYPLSSNNIKKVDDTINFFDMLKSLNYEERLIIILFYNEHYSIKEISSLLNLKENTVKSKLSRSKEKIKLNYKGGIIYE